MEAQSEPKFYYRVSHTVLEGKEDGASFFGRLPVEEYPLLTDLLVRTQNSYIAVFVFTPDQDKTRLESDSRLWNALDHEQWLERAKSQCVRKLEEWYAQREADRKTAKRYLIAKYDTAVDALGTRSLYELTLALKMLDEHAPSVSEAGVEADIKALTERIDSLETAVSRLYAGRL